MRGQRWEEITRVSVRLFAIYFAVMLLMSGMHMGFLVLLQRLGASEWVQTLVPIVYWGLAAFGLTLFTRQQVKRVYDDPMRNLAEATKRVARGDFSVYVPTIHSPDQLDYLDHMIQDFNTMVAELGSIETMRVDFVSNVSHEIKAPLAVISNYAQLLENRDLTEEKQQACVDEINRNVRRLADLVTNLLKLNKIENQVIQPQAASYDLCGQLAECALLFESAWEEKHIDMEFDTEDRAMICADREMLELVWNNLLSNAVKFTPAGGTVTVKQASDERSVTVTVSDTGCGMSQKTMGRAFEKFYQGDTSHATAGNGLGLALAKRIVEMSGGTIAVSSTLGEGSAFTVWLPVEGNEQT